MISSRRRASQSGSALLIVLVLAAMIGIMLYRELPVATFEAQRQKEELLIDRGNEYKRAVQLYVRKLQSFPPSLDALENTNRMRFLRARYVDPFTGKADWRILHAGPGGVIVDSKIKKTGTGLTGASGTTASTLGTGSSVTSPFANSFNGADPTGQQSAAQTNNFPQRPPAVSAGGGGVATSGGSTDMFGQNNGQPIDPQTAVAIQNSTAPYPGYPGPNTDSSNSPGNGSSGAYAGGAGRYRGGNPVGNSYPPGQFNQGVPQDPMQGALGTSNPPVVLNNTATAAPQQTPTTTTPSSSGLGTMNQNSVGGGIAGVASISPGRTIKVVNDQTDRSLWEFVYDMQKEMNANAPALGNSNNTNQNGTTGPSSFGGTTGTNSSGSTPSTGQSGSFLNPTPPTSNE